MDLVERHFINKQHKYYQEIDKICFLSKNLYNKALYIIRQEYIKNSKYINFYHLDKLLQKDNDYKALPAKVSQQTLKILDTNWTNYFKAKKSYFQNPKLFKSIPKIPNYLEKEKGRFITVYSTQSIKKNNILSKTNIKVTTKIKKIQQIRLIPKTFGYFIEVVHKKEEIPCKKQEQNTYLAIDIGVNNLCAITSDNIRNPILVNGRTLKSINQWYNKKKSTLKSEKKLQELSAKRYFRIQNYFHHTSKYIVDLCLKNNINKIIIGHNNGQKQNINLGKKVNQEFVSLPFLNLIQKITYKRELVGLEVILTEESYTSKSSFIDKDILPNYEDKKESPNFSGKRVKRGLYQCSDGFCLNSDVNGSLNIGRKVIGDVVYDKFDRSLVARPIRINPLDCFNKNSNME
jgi:putative transposase